MEDLSWLAEAKPTEAKILKTPRGRQPNVNPMEGHLKGSHESDSARALPMSAKQAPDAERLLRRAATRLGWTVNIQVLNADPASATTDNVVPLKDLKPTAERDENGAVIKNEDGSTKTNPPKIAPETDVWIVFHAADKPEEDTKEGSDAETKTDAPAPVTDPFKAPETTPAPANGGKGKASKLVSNP